jgi:hypothetical protein
MQQAVALAIAIIYRHHSGSFLSTPRVYEKGVLEFLVAPAFAQGRSHYTLYRGASAWERDVVAIMVRLRGQAEALIHAFISNHRSSMCMW